ncbi:hypothetical protein Mapa_000462 [Marchantia paleacea]|nr:hypothetical protein Mapa_000462 [Marchantia paleacea]
MGVTSLTKLSIIPLRRLARNAVSLPGLGTINHNFRLFHTLINLYPNSIFCSGLSGKWGTCFFLQILSLFYRNDYARFLCWSSSWICCLRGDSSKAPFLRNFLSCERTCSTLA